jgi:hypothetical protein
MACPSRATTQTTRYHTVRLSCDQRWYAQEGLRWCSAGGPGWEEDAASAAGCPAPQAAESGGGWAKRTHACVGADGGSHGLAGPGPWTLERVRVLCGAGRVGGEWAARLGARGPAGRGHWWCMERKTGAVHIRAGAALHDGACLKAFMRVCISADQAAGSATGRGGGPATGCSGCKAAVLASSGRFMCAGRAVLGRGCTTAAVESICIRATPLQVEGDIWRQPARQASTHRLKQAPGSTPMREPANELAPGSQALGAARRPHQHRGRGPAAGAAPRRAIAVRARAARARARSAHCRCSCGQRACGADRLRARCVRRRRDQAAHERRRRAL